MEAYLDNSATTPVSQGVKEIVIKTMMEDYGNPSSMHMKGVEAERYLRQAKEILAKILKVNEKEIIFTSGGTESNNLALIGIANANHRAGKHIITTSVEHASVLNTVKYLEEQGFEVTWLPVDEHGYIRLEDLEAALREDTILVSMMYVNNEIGALEPVEEAAKLIHQKNPKTIFHVDAIQAFGKYRIYPKRQGIDALSVSGHKIHGPKGTGFLYVSEKVKIKPIIFGGGQQKGMRSGTDNVPGIAGIAEAAKEAYENFDEKTERMYELKDYLIEKLSAIDGVKINSKKGRAGAPHIVNVSFVGVRSEVMLHELESHQVYVSAGSACSSNHPHISETLAGIGLSAEEIDSAIRFSFSDLTTKEELDYAADIIADRIQTLRKFTRRK